MNIDFKKNTVLGFFDSSQKSYKIPVYQRAYAWEKTQWEMFIYDIIEQMKSDNNYFYGNILLKEAEKDKKYDIIDGQQRLTTLVIFVRAILNVLQVRKELGENFEFDFVSKERIFIKDSGVKKLRPVDYDQSCFDTIIIDNKSYSVTTPSQDNIKQAKDFFESELKKFDSDKIIKIFNKLESTDLTVTVLSDEKDAALMFELQNNRGKDLTNMEKLKSYLMYQIYVYSKSGEVLSNTEEISNVFKDIYIIINDLKQYNEDNILLYHNQAYLGLGYNYRKLEEVKEQFRTVEDQKKIEWIKDYTIQLRESFQSIKKFEASKLPFAEQLRKLDVAYLVPFILRGYKYIKDDIELGRLFHLLEIIVFRDKLIRSRSKIYEKLSDTLSDFSGNVESLANKVKIKLGKEWYWSDESMKGVLDSNMYGNNILNYLLWQYEKSVQGKGYKIKEVSLDVESIEHISPQTPTDGKQIESGYEVDANNNYSDEFIKKELNNIGNLMIISKSHNSSIGNKAFSEKLESYNKNPLLNQQIEINAFADVTDSVNPKWKADSIHKRQKKIIDFAMSNWSFESV